MGIDDATSAIPSAMSVTKPPTSSHPQTTATGPPSLKPMKYDVRQPARIEMIVNEMAKFEKPPISR